MNTQNATEMLKVTLDQLKTYMHSHYPHRQFERRFWEYESDELFFEALGYLPLQMPEAVLNDLRMLDDMPPGYRLAFPIFWIEDDYVVNGWGALSNAGEWLLPRAISAYREIGLTSEGDALAAALSVIRKGLNDYDDEATEAAYKSVANRYVDDDEKIRALLRYFRSDPALFDFDGA